MHAVATSGRWIWGASGLATTAALVVTGTWLITSAGRADNAQPQSVATRTVTVSQPVTSLTVQSYGAPVEIKAGPVRRVHITETMAYDAQVGPVSVGAQPASAQPVERPSPSAPSPRAPSPSAPSP